MYIYIFVSVFFSAAGLTRLPKKIRTHIIDVSYAIVRNN